MFTEENVVARPAIQSPLLPQALGFPAPPPLENRMSSGKLNPKTLRIFDCDAGRKPFEQLQLESGSSWRINWKPPQAVKGNEKWIEYTCGPPSLHLSAFRVAKSHNQNHDLCIRLLHCVLAMDWIWWISQSSKSCKPDQPLQNFAEACHVVKRTSYPADNTGITSALVI